MSLQRYYDNFCVAGWADQSAAQCLCHGSGWALSDMDTWHRCPEHFRGQVCPEYAYDADGPKEDRFSTYSAYVEDRVRKSLALDGIEYDNDDDIPF